MVAASIVPVLRVVTASATLFKYEPPAEVLRALAQTMLLAQAHGSSAGKAERGGNTSSLVEADGILSATVSQWVESVIAGVVQPYLTAADRQLLMQLYHRKK